MRCLFIFSFIALSISQGIAQNFPISEIPSDIQENAKAVVRLEKIDLNLLSYDKLEVSKKVVITIFRQDGDFYQYLPMYYNKHTKIKSYSGIVYDATGNVSKKLKKKDYNDYSAVPSGAMYSDDRLMISEYTPSEYPYTIQLEYSYETSTTAIIPRWTPIKMHEIGLEKSVYTFINNSGIPVHTKEINFEQYKNINKSETSNGFKYTLENIPPLYNEVLGPPMEEKVPLLLISTDKFMLAGKEGSFTNWNEFGKWMYNDLIKGRQELPQEEKEQVQRLLDGVSTDREKARLLYQYMQEKTRYINVAIGIGGWQPYPASNVSNKGYGDCKALSNYMMALLQEANISSNFTIVYGDRSSKRNIRPDFPSLQGNHVILQVPLENDTIWLECTSQKTAFDYLGEFTQDRYALAINANGGKIVKTQSFSSNINLEQIEGNAKIGTDGTLNLQFKSITSGLQYDWNYPIYYLTRQEQLNQLQKRYDEIKSKEFLSFNFTNNKDSAIYTQDIHLTSKSYGQINGNNLIFPLIPVGRLSTKLTKDSSRELPVYLDNGYTDNSQFTIEIPNNYKLNYSIEPKEIKTKFGKYSLNATYLDNKIIVHRTIVMNQGTFPPEDYMHYVRFRKKVEKADNTKVLLEKQND